jgi:hypothetical protein
MRSEDRAKFVRLANQRVTKAIKAIQLVGNLSNRSNYDYDEGDALKIIKALQEELNACKKRFEMASKSQAETLFTLE